MRRSVGLTLALAAASSPGCCLGYLAPRPALATIGTGRTLLGARHDCRMVAAAFDRASPLGLLFALDLPLAAAWDVLFLPLALPLDLSQGWRDRPDPTRERPPAPRSRRAPGDGRAPPGDDLESRSVRRRTRPFDAPLEYRFVR